MANLVTMIPIVVVLWTIFPSKVPQILMILIYMYKQKHKILEML
jgi:hypothetical protein